MNANLNNKIGKTKFILALTFFTVLLSVPVKSQLLDPKSTDDRLHFSLGVFAGETGHIFNENVLKTDCDWCFTVGGAFLAGLTKETIDSASKNNRFDGGELLATTTGGIFSYGFRKAMDALGVPSGFTSGFLMFGSLAYIGVEMVFVIR